jgi:hypothetical protein
MSDVLTHELDDQPFDLEREPLDPPEPTGHDWGGDGTDPSRPVRAHVLAALRPHTQPYAPPVDALLTLGDPRTADVVERRRALDLGQENLPDLLRMARDRDLYTADSDTDEVWAPLHALLVLSDLALSADVAELVPLLDLEDDWYFTELPELFGKVGEPALEPLRAYLADHARWSYGHSNACAALEKLAAQHPEQREPVVETLSDMLRDAEHYDEVACTGAMDALIDLGEVEALPLIRHAFELGRIDEMMRGPWGDVLNDLGVEPEADDPLLAESQQRFEERHEQLMPHKQREQLLELIERIGGRDPQHLFDDTPANAPQPLPALAQASTPAPKTAQAKARKQKNKRKMESASRKANRRKRK